MAKENIAYNQEYEHFVEKTQPIAIAKTERMRNNKINALLISIHTIANQT
jgi:hypothetical protein